MEEQYAAPGFLMDPTAEEREQLTSIDTIADWVGLPGAGDDANTPRGALYAHLGVVASMHPHILAFIDHPTLQGILAEWRIQEQPDADGTLIFVTPSPVLVSQAGLASRVQHPPAGAARAGAQHRPDRFVVAADAVRSAGAA